MHPMHSGVIREVEPVVRQEVRTDVSPHVRWYKPPHDTRASMVVLVQCYSDKSVKTMKPSGVHFYPLHATLLNFSE